ncbi:MAG: hypothetical protein QM796_00100 [Chthoniobacteraceae bacterium]
MKWTPPSPSCSASGAAANFRCRSIRLAGSIIRSSAWELAAHLPITLGPNDLANALSGGDKAAFMTEAFQVMKTMPNVKAAIYWNERWQDETGYYSNLHVNSSPESLEAFRQGEADPVWLDHPVYEPKK